MGWLTASDAMDTKGESDRPDVDLWHAFLRAVESDRPDWHISAACRETDPHPFFPGHSDHPDISIPAKEMCRTCPVRLLCEDQVMAMPATTPGVWAAMSTVDRKEFRRVRRSAA